MKTDISNKYKPFSTDKQFADWRILNCDTCKKTFNETPGFEIRCTLELEVWGTFFGGGKKKNKYSPITEEVAKEIGYLDNKNSYTWKCSAWKSK